MPAQPYALTDRQVAVLEVLDIMEQLGHTDPKVTLGIYARVMRRSEGDRERLRALVDGGALPSTEGVAAPEREVRNDYAALPESTIVHSA